MQTGGGRASNRGSRSVTCPKCKGAGRVSTKLNRASGMWSFYVDQCNGRDSPGRPCKTCNGMGYEEMRVRLKVKVATGDR